VPQRGRVHAERADGRDRRAAKLNPAVVQAASSRSIDLALMKQKTRREARSSATYVSFASEDAA
jgi:hypothetical protein